MRIGSLTWSRIGSLAGNRTGRPAGGLTRSLASGLPSRIAERDVDGTLVHAVEVLADDVLLQEKDLLPDLCDVIEFA